jgi:hypothetical protein
MKKVILAFAIAFLGSATVAGVPVSAASVYDQKKDDRGKKDPPGPPVVTPKQPKDKGGDKKPPPPGKGKRPHDD